MFQRRDAPFSRAVEFPEPLAMGALCPRENTTVAHEILAIFAPSVKWKAMRFQVRFVFIMRRNRPNIALHFSVPRVPTGNTSAFLRTRTSELHLAASRCNLTRPDIFFHATASTRLRLLLLASSRVSRALSSFSRKEHSRGALGRAVPAIGHRSHDRLSLFRAFKSPNGSPVRSERRDPAKTSVDHPHEPLTLSFFQRVNAEQRGERSISPHSEFRSRAVEDDVPGTVPPYPDLSFALRFRL